MVLYRKYRPQLFSQVVGQRHVMQALTSALAQGKVAHAYLFCGPKGSGKTTTARILAKAVNCEKVKSSGLRVQSNKASNPEPQTPNPAFEPCNKCSSCLAINEGSHLDVLEIDAASNRGIDDIRDLKERITLRPVQGKTKVYIIDEAHMLTMEAFNALLKTLEEPPEHTVFILATTEPKKLPQTIISRCNRLNFSLASTQELAKIVQEISQAEGFTIDEASTHVVAQAAEGSFRDCVKLLDQIATLGTTITPEAIASLVQYPDISLASTFLAHLTEGTLLDTLQWIDTSYHRGIDMHQLAVVFLKYLRQVTFVKAGLGDTLVKAEVPSRIYRAMQDQARACSMADLATLLKLGNQAEKEQKLTSVVQLPLELVVLEWFTSRNKEDNKLPDSSTIGNNDRQTVFDSKPQSSKHSVVNTPSHSAKRPTTELSKRAGKEPSDQSQIAAVTIEPVEDEAQSIEPEELGAMLAQASDNIVRADDTTVLTEEPIATPKIVVEGQTESQIVQNIVTMSELLAKWPVYVARLAGQNHSAALLLKNSAIAEFDGKNLTLEVYYTFHKERIEQHAIKRLLHDELKNLLGTDVKITCIVKQKPKVKKETEELSDIALQIFSNESPNQSS